jgi:hypothetical protein
VLSKSEITAADLPKPRVPPHGRGHLERDALRRVADRQGARFEPAKALQVLLNDQVLASPLPNAGPGIGKIQVRGPGCRPSRATMCSRSAKPALAAHSSRRLAYYEIMQSD